MNAQIRWDSVALPPRMYPSACAHLLLLVAGGLVEGRQQTRHRVLVHKDRVVHQLIVVAEESLLLLRPARE